MNFSKKNDSIDFRDFIIKFRLEFLSKLFIYLFIIVVGAIIGFYFAYKSKPIYKANSRFIVKELTGSGGLANALGSLTSLLGTAGASNIDKTLVLLSSREVVGKSLFRKATIQNKSDLLINHFIRLKNMYEKMDLNNSDSLFQKAYFHFKDTSPVLFNKYQRYAYNSVFTSFIRPGGIVQRDSEKKSGVINLKVSYYDEEFVIEASRIIYWELVNYFRSQTSENMYLNIEILKNKVDSIQFELDKVRSSIAKENDISYGVILNQDKVKVRKLLSTEQVLLLMYGEAQKNLETFSFMGQSASNGINLSLIDYPYSPIKPSYKNKVLYLFLGALISLLIICNIIFVRIKFL